MVGAPVGTEIILRCSIQASPKPMTFWMRKEGKIFSNLEFEKKNV